MSVSTSPTFTGCVKWFNNKTGYGFITCLSTKTDVFVHHSGIVNVDSTKQYKYLVQGEYVEFQCIITQDPKHEIQATNVTGIQGGKLMCETRNENKLARNEYMEKENQQELDIPLDIPPRVKKIYKNKKILQ
jgi:cold shock CspA family protein